MEQLEYIIPTKKKPVFEASCDHFGYIEGPYKDYLVGDTLGETFALSFTEAVTDLHQWIKDHPELVAEYPKAKWEIYFIDGSIDKKLDQTKKERVYSISSSKAKRLLL